MEGHGNPRSNPDTCCTPSASVRANSNPRISFVQESDNCRSITWHQSSGSSNGRPTEPDLQLNAHCRQTSQSVEDLGDLQTALEADKKSIVQQQQPRQKFETVAEMANRFVQYFSTLHLERECTAGVFICAVCLSAQKTLAKIREAVRKDPQGRRVALNNGKFMKLLVKLCQLESPGSPSICTVTDREMTAFYETQAYRKLVGTVSILEDEKSEDLWKCILGKAAKSIRPLTYAIRLRGSRIPGGSSCVWDKDCYDQPPQGMLMSQPKAVGKGNPYPVSDLKTLDVIRCVDARHLIVYRTSSGKASVDALNLLLAEFHQDLTSGPREDPPNVGDIVGLFESRDRLLRMLVVEVTEDMAVVWSMDQGNFCRLRWSNLIDVLPSFTCLPPSVGLGVLPDVHAVPSLRLLRECVRTIQTLTDHSSQEEVWRGHTQIEAWQPIAPKTKVIPLMHSALFSEGRPAHVVSLECMPTGEGLCAFAFEEEMLQTSKVVVYCDLCNYETVAESENEQRGLKDYKAIEVLTGLLNCPDYDTRMITAKLLNQLCCRQIGRQAVSKVGCVDKVLGRLRKLLTIRQRQTNYHMISDEKLSLVILLQSMFFRNEELCLDYADSDHVSLLSKVYHGLSPACQLYQEVDYCLRTLLGPAYNKCRLPAQAKQVAMTTEKMNCLSPSDEPSLALQHYNEKKAVGRFYQRDSLVPFHSDQTHELRPVRSMRMASTRTLSKVACSFLNSWKPCIVYYGITREGVVRGVMLNHKERDCLRQGIDFMACNLRPRLMPQSIAVEFVPVLRTPSDSHETASCFVVEVTVRGAPDTVYTTSCGDCYLRAGDMSYQATTQDVRAWIVQQEEARYLRTSSLAPMSPVRPAAVSNSSLYSWHRVVY